MRSNLLHEYFACPSRFYFLALQGLQPDLGQLSQHVVLDELADAARAGFVGTALRHDVGQCAGGELQKHAVLLLHARHHFLQLQTNNRLQQPG